VEVLHKADVAAVRRTVVAVEELHTAADLVMVPHTAVAAVRREAVAIEVVGHRSLLVDSSVPDSRSLVIQVVLMGVAAKIMGYWFPVGYVLRIWGRQAGDVLYKRVALGTKF
jgi:hypothetical protein